MSHGCLPWKLSYLSRMSESAGIISVKVCSITLFVLQQAWREFNGNNSSLLFWISFLCLSMSFSDLLVFKC